jgi:hypothetical protein
MALAADYAPWGGQKGPSQMLNDLYGWFALIPGDTKPH